MVAVRGAVDGGVGGRHLRVGLVDLVERLVLEFVGGRHLDLDQPVPVRHGCAYALLNVGDGAPLQRNDVPHRHAQDWLCERQSS